MTHTFIYTTDHSLHTHPLLPAAAYLPTYLLLPAVRIYPLLPDAAYLPIPSCLLLLPAPLLLDICSAMVYLHSCNIVHGGTWGGQAQVH